MQLLVAVLLILGAKESFAKLHSIAVCVANRHYIYWGGLPNSPSYSYYKQYEILKEPTKCACSYYLRRNKGGTQQWDHCHDCHIEKEMLCVSHGWHIGGDEFDYYCEQLCGAQGSEAN
ncbi:uncharacterized protein RSE6_10144 [Rhynchosporium secalis]|uniref:Uncharacterized protein n=1 Tax=Rhynchosporium secalis TaxID=38038 RepID=A0A1E1MJN7_RHYSE|nr:uncharacterized protein RSE6_10144 [Rhynchosporium secalis]